MAERSAQMKRTKSKSSPETGTAKRRKGEKHIGAESGLPEILPLYLTGARQGDIIEGTHPDETNGTLLKVAEGFLPASIEEIVKFDRDDFIGALGKQFNESPPFATLRYDDILKSSKEVQGKVSRIGSAPGCNCKDFEACSCPSTAKFVILQPGVWSDFAENAGHLEELDHIVKEERIVTAMDILPLMGRKVLILRPVLFKVSTGPQRVTDVPSGAYLVDTTASGQLMPPAELTVYRIADCYIGLPPSDKKAFHSSDVRPLVIEVLKDHMQGIGDLNNEVDMCLQYTREFSQGALKSALQKVIRFAPLYVTLGQEKIQVNAKVYAATVMAELLADPGMFNPDLQMFIVGRSAAFKRLGVILVEDVWIQKINISVLTALFGLAIACQEMRQWYPPRTLLINAVAVACLAVRTPVICDWRRYLGSGSEETITPHESHAIHKFSKQALDDQQIRHLNEAARMLAIAKSFPGDIRMYETTASYASQTKTLRLISYDRTYATPIMPDVHIWDQHNKRGIGHILAIDFESTFLKRFKKLFNEITGKNPRFEAVGDQFEERPVVKQARWAQTQIMRKVQKIPLTSLPVLRTEVVHMNMHPGVLAAGVGPIEIQAKGIGTKVYVMLGMINPSDEIVMKKPSREAKDEDLYSSLTDEQKQKAIEVARSKSHAVSSPFLSATKSDQASFNIEKQAWLYAGKDWSEIVERGIFLEVDVHPNPSLLVGDPSTWLNNDALLAESFSVEGSGIVVSAKDYIAAIIAVTSPRIIMRARSLIRQQYTQVLLPTPALDGNISAGKLAPYDNDWIVYRFILLLSRLVPGALKPEEPPGFKIQNAVLLRWLETLIVVPSLQDADLDAWSARWQKVYDTVEGRLLPHQLSALTSLKRRDEYPVGGHILVMPTGAGKTITSIAYVAHRVLKTPIGHMVNKVIWVAPPESLESLKKDMEQNMNVPVHLVPTVSRSKASALKGIIDLKDGYINLISDTNMDLAMKIGNLGDSGPTSLLVLDEFDRAYNTTLRTSACRELARRCPLFVAQTATPMSKKVNALAEWLADTETFPVNDSNYLVAASNMVAIQLDLGIARHVKVMTTAMVDEVRQAYHKYQRDGLWGAFANTTQQYTDNFLCATAKQYIEQDLKINGPGGGVLLVADSVDHADKLLLDMNGLDGIKAILFDPSLPDKTHEKPEYNCVIVKKTQDRGYNFAIRLGAIVKGVYAGNPSSRQQMNGRITRLGQKRRDVYYVTVYMENSILQLLYERQISTDGMNISLEQLAQTFKPT